MADLHTAVLACADPFFWRRFPAQTSEAPSTGDAQLYKYNGKKLDSQGGLYWYDYEVRHYDATLGRWHVVDPKTEKYYDCLLYTSDIVLALSTEKNPIVFQNVPRKKYPEKIHQMVYDSVYYLPTHTVPKSEKRYIWNKKFKVYICV